MAREEKSAENLLHILQEECRLTADLIGFAQEKTQILARGDAKGLNDLLAVEEETVIALRDKEEERIRTAKELADALCVSPDNLSIRELAQRMKDPELSRRLVSAGNEVVLKIRELSRHNGKAKRLLKHQVSYTSFMLNLLLGTQDKALFYNVQGNMEDKENRISRLNYRA